MNENPSDLGVKFELATELEKNEFPEEALELALEIVKTNKNWEDQKANKFILEVFKKLGSSSPVTQKYRKLYQRYLY